MKFDCGMPPREKRQITLGRRGTWHRKFAWLPREVGHRDCRWLEFVERKDYLVYKDPYGYWESHSVLDVPHWEYRAIK